MRSSWQTYSLALSYQRSQEVFEETFRLRSYQQLWTADVGYNQQFQICDSPVLMLEGDSGRRYIVHKRSVCELPSPDFTQALSH